MSKRLLIVDDAPIIRELIKFIAVQNEWEIAGEAGDGEEAIEVFRDVRPDVTTLDLVMPQADGLHALDGILAVDASAIVLMVSALEQHKTLQRAISKGAAGFVGKPFDKKKLAAKLERLHERSQEHSLQRS